jgi:hypothetical protein
MPQVFQQTLWVSGASEEGEGQQVGWPRRSSSTSARLHIQGLAAFVEQFSRKRAGRRLGRAFAMRGSLIAQESLDLLPQLPAHYRLVLPWMAFLLVTDFAQVDRVRQHLVQSAARELPASRSHAVFRHPDFGDDPAALQIAPQ